MGCVDCGGDSNWANCDTLDIEKGTNRLPKKLIIQPRAEVAPNGSNGLPTVLVRPWIRDASVTLCRGKADGVCGTRIGDSLSQMR
jgi:hypothetical protein